MTATISAIFKASRTDLSPSKVLLVNTAFGCLKIMFVAARIFSKFSVRVGSPLPLTVTISMYNSFCAIAYKSEITWLLGTKICRLVVSC
ncbi:hypothetical protein [Trichormus azollae]|uniref:hypothetical protein n=1 Tax=Trichormus azollae TaxID=1164 RepID=UPI00117C77E8|nr:hypothetical protein [Trichormus azollae]